MGTPTRANASPTMATMSFNDDDSNFQNPSSSSTSSGKRDTEWLHGEVQFEETNLHARYLIVPEGVKDACDVIAVMCALWGLRPPELFLALDGGQDTPPGMMRNVLDQDAWNDGNHVTEEAFGEALIKTSRGIAQACSESRAWVYGFDGSYGSADSDALWGTCLNAAWSYFGQGRRTAPGGQGVEFVCAKGLRGLFGEPKFRKHAVSLSRCVERVVHYPSVSHTMQRDGKTVPDCMEAQNGVRRRPEKSKMIWPEFTHIVLFDGDPAKHPYPDIYKAMKALAATVHVVAGGVHPTLTNSLVTESENVPVVVLKHTGGAADVIARALELRKKGSNSKIHFTYTQSADDFLEQKEEWRSMRWSAMHASEAAPWSMPPFIGDSNIVVIDVKEDSTYKVVDKILRILAYSEDGSEGKAGSPQSEHEMLQTAWKTVVCYKYNAENSCLASTIYTYCVMVLVMTTMMGWVLEVTRSRPQTVRVLQPAVIFGRSLEELELGAVLVVLPIMLGILLGCAGSRSQHQKWGLLTNAANVIKTEIYCCRARVGDYARRPRSNFDTADRLRKMPAVNRELVFRKAAQVSSQVNTACNSPARTPGRLTPSPLGGEYAVDVVRQEHSREPLLGGHTVDEDDLMTAWRTKSRGNGGRKGANRSRHSIFMRMMEQVHTELWNGDVRLASLSEPTRTAVQRERAAMVGVQPEDFSKIKHIGDEFQPRSLQDKVLGSTADDGFSTLLAHDYIRFRVQPTILDLTTCAQHHARVIFWLETLKYVATLSCTIVAALDMCVLVPILVALISLIISVMDYHHFVLRLQSVNTSLADLRNLLLWFDSLDTREKRAKSVMYHLVDVTETALQADFVGARKPPIRPTEAKDDIPRHESGGISDNE